LRIGMRQLSGAASSYKLLEIFLQNCDNNTNGGIMDNRKLNRRNLLLLLFVVAACIMGGRSIFGFFALLTGYETAATEVSAIAASEMYMMFLLFLVCIIGGIAMSCLSKAKVSRTFFLIRNAVLVVALVLGNMSFPNITIMSTVVMSKYIGDAGMYDFAMSSPLLVSALRQPYLFYTYMAAEGLMIILACVTVYKYIVDKKKNSNYNNMYM